MPQQFLNRTDVVAGFEKLRRKGAFVLSLDLVFSPLSGF
jgi:hypothetical protein